MHLLIKLSVLYRTLVYLFSYFINYSLFDIEINELIFIKTKHKFIFNCVFHIYSIIRSGLMIKDTLGFRIIVFSYRKPGFKTIKLYI